MSSDTARAALPTSAGKIVVAALSCVALFVVGCTDNPDDADTQPVQDAPEFGTGTFDDLPRLDGSRELTEATGEGDIISQSFGLTGSTPDEVLRFYRRELPETGWLQIGVVQQLEGDALRGEWRNGDLLLEVSSAPAPTLGNDVAAERPTVQYSLILRPPSENDAG